MGKRANSDSGKRSGENRKPGFLKRFFSFLRGEPEDRGQLLRLLRAACARGLLDADALSIAEGALAASDTAVREVMVPRAQMGTIAIDATREEVLATVIAAAHSRFPVLDGDRDNVVGILLAKDLLRLCNGARFDLRASLRPAAFVPESKRIDALLREFRVSRNHMAIVVDEYGGVSGLVTIEDVLEQLVGDIEDEYDSDETGDNIRQDQSGRYRVRARTELADFNRFFGCALAGDGVDTVGGLILSRLGYMPRRHEVLEIDGFSVRVLRADRRRLHSLLVEPLSPADQVPAGAPGDTPADTSAA